MSADAGIQIAVGVLRVLADLAPEAIEAIRGETVGDLLARGRAHLPAPGAARAAVDEIFAKSPTLPPPADRFRIARTVVPAVERFLAGHVARDVLLPEEVSELRVLLDVARALERGELVPTVPVVLDPPVAAWAPPASSED